MLNRASNIIWKISIVKRLLCVACSIADSVELMLAFLAEFLLY